MTTVAVDARMIQWSGVGTYISHMLERMVQADSCEFVLLGDPEELHRFPWSSRCRITPFDHQPYRPAEQVAFRFMKRDWDVFWSPQVNAPLRPHKPLVVTVHDLAPIALPEAMPSRVRRSYWRLLFNRAVKTAHHVLADSNFTREEILRHADVPPEKITVVYPGVSSKFRPAPKDAVKRLRDRHNLVEPFVLYVGNVKPHKNIGTLLDAFQALHQSGKAPLLALAGKDVGFGSGIGDLGREISRRGLTERVKRLGVIPDRDLPVLYTAAEFLVFPSLYEGFGLPAVEAMACGTPVITSDIPVLLETVGEDAIHVPARNASRLATEISALMSDPKRRAAMSNSSIRRARRFGWEEPASKALRILEEVSRGRRPTRCVHRAAPKARPSKAKLDVLLVTGYTPPEPCGVGHYTVRLNEALRQIGIRSAIQNVTNFAGVRDLGNRVNSDGPAVVHFMYPARGYHRSLVPLFVPAAVRPTRLLLGLHEYRASHPLRKLIIRALAARAWKTIVSTAGERDSLPCDATIVPVPPNVIENPGDIPSLRVRQNPSPIRLAFFGFLNPKKGAETLIRAMARLQGKGRPVRLKVIGQTPSELQPFVRSFRREIDMLGLRNNVEFTGTLSEEAIIEELRKSDLCVLPFADGASARHATLTTALQSGVPVITSTGPDVPSGLSAYLVPPGSPDALARAIEHLSEDPQARLRLSRAGQHFARVFSWTHVASRLARLYNI